MPSEAAEAIRTRREDRPQGGSGPRSRRISRTTTADPDDWARAFNAYVSAWQGAGRTDSAELALFVSARTDPDPFYAQALMLLEKMIQKFPVEAEARGLLWAQSYLGRLARVEPAQDFRLEQPDSERELKLYKEELKRLRSEQDDQNRQARGRRKSISAHLAEAIALAHPIALRLLGWLHVSGKLDLARVFEVFGASSSTFEGVARLHLIGALRFDDGRLAITSVGTRALRELEIIDDEEGEDLDVNA